MRTVLFGAIALLLGLAEESHAQRFEVAASGGFHVLSGEDFDGTDGGFGGELVGRYHVSNRFSLGVGGLWNRHRLDPADADYAVPSLFVEPRYAFGDDRQAMRPFAAARLGWVRQSLGLPGPDRVADGTGVGLTAGLLIPVSGAFGAEAALDAYQAWFGDFDLDGEVIPDSESSGRSLGLRLGIYWLN